MHTSRLPTDSINARTSTCKRFGNQILDWQSTTWLQMQIGVVVDACIQYFLDHEALTAKQLTLLQSQLLAMGKRKSRRYVLAKLVAMSWTEDVYKCLVLIFKELLPQEFRLSRWLLAEHGALCHLQVLSSCSMYCLQNILFCWIA